MAARGFWGRRSIRLLALVGALVAADAWARTQPWSAPRYSSFLHYQQVFPPALRPGVGPDGEAMLGTIDPRHPVQWVRAQKAPDSLRVVCFGGSAAAGLGFSPNVTFAHHLEILLRAAYPARPIEVVNLGTVAIASKQVLELVRDTVQHADPDLVVIYSGNNEFLEPQAVRYAELHRGVADSLRGWLRRSALIRGLERWRLGPPTPQDLPDRSGGQRGMTQSEVIEDVELSPEEIAEQVEAYAANLLLAVRACEQAKVPVLVATVAANANWSGKEARIHDWNASDDRAQLEARAQAIQDRLQSGQGNVKERWQRWLELGDLSVALEESEQAGEAYRHALDIDPHQRRATFPQARALQNALKESQAVVFDTNQFLLARSERGWIGFDVFYDYVHFTPYGAALVAEGMFDQLRTAGLLEAAQPIEILGYASGYRDRVAAQVLTPGKPDFLERGDFLGIGFDPTRIRSRDLWKYEQMAEELERHMASDPQDAVAWIYRGNRRWFQQGQGEGALADWAHALELGGPGDLLRGAMTALK
ncbi:MAG TPA: hypothetical protein P5218_08585, partial [Planctomycetota bacterium]|nr:hypothetical protein [Planctomycetota bacterium]